jgi:hypothetical protein
MSYCTIDQAKAAGASGTDTEIQAAIDSAGPVINQYTREIWEPTTTTIMVAVSYGVGRLSRWAASVQTGSLGSDGYTWYAGYMASGEFPVTGDFGSRETPLGVQLAAARLAATYSPIPFTAQADAEGNPIGRPPASTEQDGTDPGPPQQRQGVPASERTTGDPIVDAWLEPYKTNRVLV